MSHLTILIKRVTERLKVYDNDPEKASEDPLWLQQIVNLKQYQDFYDDYTDSEADEANRLYNIYSKYIQEENNR